MSHSAAHKISINTVCSVISLSVAILCGMLMECFSSIFIFSGYSDSDSVVFDGEDQSDSIDNVRYMLSDHLFVLSYRPIVIIIGLKSVFR